MIDEFLRLTNGTTDPRLEMVRKAISTTGLHPGPKLDVMAMDEMIDEVGLPQQLPTPTSHF